MIIARKGRRGLEAERKSVRSRQGGIGKGKGREARRKDGVVERTRRTWT